MSLVISYVMLLYRSILVEVHTPSSQEIPYTTGMSVLCVCVCVVCMCPCVCAHVFTFLKVKSIK